MSDQHRTPPHNLAAEESLLGAMLLSRDAIAAATEVVRAEHFYKPAHGHVFDAITSLYNAGDPADVITTAEELTRAGLLDTVGGPGLLVTLQTSAPAVSNARRYAVIVEELALLRSMIATGGEIAELGYSLPDDVTKAVDHAESMIFRLAEHRQTTTTRSVHDLLSGTLDRLEQLYERGESVTGLPTGYVDLDEMLAGLQPNALIVVGARPAVGKALAVDTPLPTPTGWTTMGEIRPGDQLIDETGTPCTVTAATGVQHDRECFLVTFDDGSTIVADADHQWFAYDLPAWKAKRNQHYRHVEGYAFNPARNLNLARDQRARRKLARVVTTRQMLAEGLTVQGRPNWYLPLVAPVELPERDLPLDPYLLGCWLGDGHTSSAAITTEDEEIVEAFRDAGYQMVPKVAAGKAMTYSISFGHSTSKPWLQKMPDAAIRAGRERVAAGEAATEVAQELAGRYGFARHDYVLTMLTGTSRPFAEDRRPSFAGALIGLGVIRNKHIPAAYLRASAKQRLALLQGLLDTDGTVNRSNGTVELCLANLDLLREARELVCSLGDKPGQIRHRVVRLPGGRQGDAWRFYWTPQGDVFRLARKSAALDATRSGRAHGRHTRRAIVSISPVPTVPVKCITVDSPASLYLAGESMIPTHNTSFALGAAAHAALHAGRPVLVFSLEMSELEITQRLLCSEARVDASRMKSGKLTDSDWEKIGRAVGPLAEAKIWVDDNPNVTVMEIRSKARKLKAQLGDLGLVVIDYVQLMTGRTSAENRQVEVSEISRGLKILAREIEAPVMLLAQLNRGVEQRADKRPMLSDLRESGSLEQDADVVLLGYRDEIYNRDSPDQGIAEWNVAKHRSGPTGTVRLAFLGQYTRFANMARGPAAPPPLVGAAAGAGGPYQDN